MLVSKIKTHITFIFFFSGLISSWNNLLKWSENASNARRLQEEIISQKQLLDTMDVENSSVLNSEEAIREKIIELMVIAVLRKLAGLLPNLDYFFLLFFYCFPF